MLPVTDQTNPTECHLRRATAADHSRIENLMQFYNYDLSESYPLSFGENGLYTLRPKQDYWSAPTVHPYLIEVGTALAGFAVVDQEVVAPTSTYNLGYFFIGRRFRHQGIGKQIVRQLLQHYPGEWEIYHLRENDAAKQFWSSVITTAGIADVKFSEQRIDDEICVLYRFSSIGLAQQEPHSR